MRISTFFGVSAVLALAACQDPASTSSEGSRSEIRIVGSSTVFPFAKAVSETFVNNDPARQSPILESTGTGGGMQLFCEGVGARTPDIVNASRRMKPSELAMCQENRVDEVVEFFIGTDGIAFAQSVDGAQMNLTTEDLYKATAARPYGEANSYENWSDIRSNLPNVPILIFGPPTTSGTRDAFEEVIMTEACEADPKTAALKDTDKDEFTKICTDIRNDGKYVNAGENDNLIIQKLTGNSSSFGIFSFSYLEDNADRIRGVSINGAQPTYESIATGQYPAVRPLYFYVKKRHIDVIPGMRDYVQEFIDAAAPDTYLADIGLIAVPERGRQAIAQQFETMTALSAEELGE